MVSLTDDEVNLLRELLSDIAAEGPVTEVLAKLGVDWVEPSRPRALE